MSKGKHRAPSILARLKARRERNRALILRTLREARLARVMRTAR
jgi:hypothetical protein